ncbi:flagellar biosynthetic protein FliR [Roseicella aquatilis]|uniref:Type III secretion protein n=1 Tax=Roseicella aquatilis TaxID=2527868 RepID=A0A4R4D379_9PROT|nr:flagellar biosynthetic protein FliR [Roseicella aquatilis]TCZ53677.1 type III secretion protein [Roseicella aquatilis]
MTEAELLAQLPVLAFQAALLFCRLGACGLLLPGLGEADVPAQIRLAMALALVPLLLPVLGPALPPAPEGAAEAARLVATEVLIGLWIGWLARLAALALGMAGQAVGFLIGLSSVLVQDPALGGAGGPLSRLLGVAAAALTLGSGLYRLPLRALAESYALLPAGAAVPTGQVAETLAGAIGGSLDLALRLAAPFVLLSLLVQVAAGLVGRVAPQTQAFVLVLPVQVAAGLGLLALLLPALLAHWLEAAEALWQRLPGLG